MCSVVCPCSPAGQPRPAPRARGDRAQFGPCSGRTHRVGRSRGFDAPGIQRSSDRPGATVMWFRRDLRLGDNPALVEAVHQAGPAGSVVPVFVFDRRLWGPAGDARRAYLRASLESLRDGSVDWSSATVTRSPCCRRSRGRRTRRACMSPRTSDRTGASATVASRRRWPSSTSSWSGPGRRTPCPPAACGRRATTDYRSSRRSRGPGSTTAGPAATRADERRPGTRPCAVTSGPKATVPTG